MLRSEVQIGQPRPAFLLDIVACHSCPLPHFHHTFLLLLGVTSAGVMYASIPGQTTEVSGSIVEQLNTLASDHQTIEDDIDGIEDRLEELEKNISPVTPGGNNRYLNQRVSDLEKFVGEKDEADKNEKTLYQRVVDLENTVADIKA